MTSLEMLRYPIGQAVIVANPEAGEIECWIRDIAALPEQLVAATAGLTEKELETPYRPGGWTARQVVHHLADSHIHAYTRFKLAVTEDMPTIKPYHETLWSQTPDAQHGDISLSLNLLQALHRRWVSFLETMDGDAFARALYHPERERQYTLLQMLQTYAWHGKHHLAHIALAKQAASDADTQ